MLSRLTAALSVRSRLIVLSLLPVVGFVAIGSTYLSSEREVDACSSPRASRMPAGHSRKR
jgi:hypothetical protein